MSSEVEVEVELKFIANIAFFVLCPVKTVAPLFSTPAANFEVNKIELSFPGTILRLWKKEGRCRDSALRMKSKPNPP